MDLKKIEENICKTGFKLEYEIATTLKEEGWSIITNKYYLDDHEESVREIDILAYKWKVISDISIYTAVIISCKKNDANAWALLSRDIEKHDPNADWQPFKGYSNNVAISYYLEKNDWKSKYYERMLKPCPDIFSRPAFEIFAFQEISKEKSTCQNDKNIFNAITSLMKAQAYELNSLKANRIKDRSVFYQFNLISVIDSELVRVKFEGDKIEASKIESDDYVSKYILNKKTSVSKIKFLTARKFREAIKPYSTLHTENYKLINELDISFYHQILKARDRTQVLMPEYKSAIKRYLWSPYYSVTKGVLDVEKFDLGWNERTGEAIIEIDISREAIAALNDDDACIKAAKKILEDVFRYRGGVYVEEGIIF